MTLTVMLVGKLVQLLADSVPDSLGTIGILEAAKLSEFVVVEGGIAGSQAGEGSGEEIEFTSCQTGVFGRHDDVLVDSGVM